jgi:hypothetical protein
VLLKPDISRISQADIDPAGRWAVAVVGGRSLIDGSQGKERHYRHQIRDMRKAEGMKDDVPVLPLIHIDTGEVQALQWPNIESLSPARKD